MGSWQSVVRRVKVGALAALAGEGGAGGGGGSSRSNGTCLIVRGKERGTGSRCRELGPFEVDCMDFPFAFSSFYTTAMLWRTLPNWMRL